MEKDTYTREELSDIYKERKNNIKGYTQKEILDIYKERKEYGKKFYLPHIYNLLDMNIDNEEFYYSTKSSIDEQIDSIVNHVKERTTHDQDLNDILKKTTFIIKFRLYSDEVDNAREDFWNFTESKKYIFIEMEQLFTGYPNLEPIRKSDIENKPKNHLYETLSKYLSDNAPSFMNLKFNLNDFINSFKEQAAIKYSVDERLEGFKSWLKKEEKNDHAENKIEYDNQVPIFYTMYNLTENSMAFDKYKAAKDFLRITDRQLDFDVRKSAEEVLEKYKIFDDCYNDYQNALDNFKNEEIKCYEISREINYKEAKERIREQIRERNKSN